MLARCRPTALQPYRRIVNVATQSIRHGDTNHNLRSNASRRSLHGTARAQQRDTNVRLSNEQKSHDAPTSARIQGLIRSVRKQKRVAFARISDGSCYETVQAVLSPEQAKDLTTGAYVDLTGKWVQSQGPGQSYELQVESINELGDSDAEENPIQKKATTSEFLRTIPHLRMRTAFGDVVTRIRSHIIRGVSDYFDSLPDTAIQVHPPVITSSDCEGAGEVFTIAPKATQPSQPAPTGERNDHFFGEPKYLTVSAQLHLEAYSAELGNVWTLSPTFRAEPSDTQRHLAEFYMLEAEFRGTSSLNEVIDHAEQLIKHVTAHLANHRCGTDLLAYYHNTENNPDLTTRWEAITSQSWQRITYATALSALQAAHNRDPTTFAFPPTYSGGLNLEHERWLVTNLASDRPLVVMDYPRNQKPFYMLPTDASSPTTTTTTTTQSAQGEAAEEAGQTVAAFDILLPFGLAEVCGGSLREHRLLPLLAAMRKRGMLTLPSSSAQPQQYPGLQPGETLGSLQWYADLRRFGSSRHGGFGIGFDRLLAFLVGVGNVRETSGFPRWVGRCAC